MRCKICGEYFQTSRKHTKTCSSRCRLILFKLKRFQEELLLLTDVPLFIKSKGEISFDSFLKIEAFDHSGYHREIMYGFTDDKGIAKIVLYRIKQLKYLDTWNEDEGTYEHEIFAYD